MDWAHAALGAVSVALLIVIVARRVRRSGLHIRFDWTREDTIHDNDDDCRR